MSSLLGLERKQKNCSNTFSHISISFFHLELKRYTLTCDQAIFFSLRSHAPVVPSKTIPDSKPLWPQNHTLWGGTYIYAPPPPPHLGYDLDRRSVRSAALFRETAPKAKSPWNSKRVSVKRGPDTCGWRMRMGKCG